MGGQLPLGSGRGCSQAETSTRPSKVFQGGNERQSEGEDVLRLLLEPSSSLLCTPASQGEGLAIILGLIIDGCKIKVRHRAKAHIIRAVLTLQPLSQLFLRTSLTQVIKVRASLLIAVFMLENGDSLLAARTETIPVFSTGGGTSSETPNELACWYSTHRPVLSLSK